MNGRDHSRHGRGHNVVVVDATTGNVTTISVQCLFNFLILLIFIFQDIVQHYTGSEKIILNKLLNKSQKKQMMLVASFSLLLLEESEVPQIN